MQFNGIEVKTSVGDGKIFVTGRSRASAHPFVSGAALLLEIHGSANYLCLVSATVNSITP